MKTPATNLTALTPDLNDRERAVLTAAIVAAEGNGYDFTFGDEVVVECSSLTAQQVGGYLSALQSKGYLYVDGDIQTNGRALGTSQITFEGRVGKAMEENGGDWILEKSP